MSKRTPALTPQRVYQDRRKFIKCAIALGLLPAQVLANKKPEVCANSSFDAVSKTLTPTDFKFVSSYNNYYEFTTNKEMVKHIARDFSIHDWTLSVDGLVKQNINLNLGQLKDLPACERIYKLRCVEGWSAVVPWQGFELASLLKMAQPETNARYVVFTSVYRPEQMPGQRSATLPWPYSEALRLDEAMHGLTILATGMYGKPLPKQNGAPVRLVVPWKYGFKSIKAVIGITLVEDKPRTSWQIASPEEYGFYANVNPNVPHPRWSQRRELPLGEKRKIKTDMFNGYFDEVKMLYENDDIDALF